MRTLHTCTPRLAVLHLCKNNAQPSCAYLRRCTHCGVAPANAAHTCTPCLATGVGHYAQDDEKALAMVVALQRLGLVAKFYAVANTSNAVDRACLAKGTLQAINAMDEPESLKP